MLETGTDPADGLRAGPDSGAGRLWRLQADAERTSSPIGIPIGLRRLLECRHPIRMEPRTPIRPIFRTLVWASLELTDALTPPALTRFKQTPRPNYSAPLAT